MMLLTLDADGERLWGGTKGVDGLYLIISAVLWQSFNEEQSEVIIVLEHLDAVAGVHLMTVLSSKDRETLA